jgi:hypothetical protein
MNTSTSALPAAQTSHDILLDVRDAFAAFVARVPAKPSRQGKQAHQAPALSPVKATPGLPVLPLTNDPSRPLPPGRPSHLIQVPRLCEADYVERIVDWLQSHDDFEDATFRPGAGIAVRLRSDRNQLLQEGVPILQRWPSVLLDLPEGTATSNRQEARALCAVAKRPNGLRLYGRGKR